MRPTLARAEGIHVWDVEGRRFLDGTSGAFCVQLGYTRPDLIRAMSEAAARLPHARPSQFESEESAAYRAELLAAAGLPYRRVVLTGSGSEAVEAAIKLAWGWQAARGHPERTRVVSLEGHFHGATLAALGATGYRARRGPYEPLLGPRAFGPPAHCARCFRGLTYPDCDLACADAAFAEGDPPAAFLAETIPAAGLGAPVPPPGWPARVRSRCDEAEALWIADEVLAGFGRAGSLFAWRRLGERGADGSAAGGAAPGAAADRAAIPDLVVFGKGAGAGFAPLSGVLVSARVADPLEASGATGGLGHHQTHGGNPIACAVGRRVLAAMAEERVFEEVRAKEGAFDRALDALRGHARVADVRGIGFLRGVALREAGASEAVAACRRRGVLLHAAGDDAVLLAPPLVAPEEALAEIAGTLAAALG